MFHTGQKVWTFMCKSHRMEELWEEKEEDFYTTPPTCLKMYPKKLLKKTKKNKDINPIEEAFFELRGRENRRIKPLGEYANGIWYPYPMEVQKCCKTLALPPRSAQPLMARQALYKHCITAVHVANIYGVKKSRIIELNKYSHILPESVIAKIKPLGHYQRVLDEYWAERRKMEEDLKTGEFVVDKKLVPVDFSMI